MGIFNNASITAIQSLNGNLPIFRQCQHYRINVSAGVMTQIIEQTPQPKARRITIKNTGDSVIIFKGENVAVTESAFDLVPGERLVDDQDGGIAWYAKSQAGSVLDIAIESTPGVTS